MTTGDHTGVTEVKYEGAMELINGQPQNHTYSPDSSAPEMRTCLQGQKQKARFAAWMDVPVGVGGRLPHLVRQDLSYQTVLV